MDRARCRTRLPFRFCVFFLSPAAAFSKQQAAGGSEGGDKGGDKKKSSKAIGTYGEADRCTIDILAVLVGRFVATYSA